MTAAAMSERTSELLVRFNLTTAASRTGPAAGAGRAA